MTMRGLWHRAVLLCCPSTDPQRQSTAVWVQGTKTWTITGPWQQVAEASMEADFRLGTKASASINITWWRHPNNRLIRWMIHQTACRLQALPFHSQVVVYVSFSALKFFALPFPPPHPVCLCGKARRAIVSVWIVSKRCKYCIYLSIGALVSRGCCLNISVLS